MSVDTSSKLEDHITREEKNKRITDDTIKDVKDLIHKVYTDYKRSIWTEFYKEFHFAKLDRMTEIKGQAIKDYIKRKYFHSYTLKIDI